MVICNADPAVTLRLLGDAADPDWRRKVLAWPMQSATLKVNFALRTLPDFTARPGTDGPHHRAVINTPLSAPQLHAAYQTARAGQLPARLWTEIYLQSVYDQSVAPAGTHTMSVFAQYAPTTFASGDWDSHRVAAGQLVIDAIARFCPSLPDAIIDHEVLGPPDIEARVGLTGGHIFQGECLPDYMWDKRFAQRTPMPGVFLCGACTHPGGGVVGINGRNAAMELLHG